LETSEEHGGDEGLLSDVFAGETEEEKGKLTQALLKLRRSNAKSRLKEIGSDREYAEERKTLEEFLGALDRQAESADRLKFLQQDLQNKLAAKYVAVAEDEIQSLVVEDKWLGALAAAVQGELYRVSQTLSGRVRQLAERYATPLPRLAEELATLAASVDGHLEKMGAVWE
jgi:type I restriction enzyme M protein